MSRRSTISIWRLFVLLCWICPGGVLPTVSSVDVVAIVPSRFRESMDELGRRQTNPASEILHNGLVFGAFKNNLTLEMEAYFPGNISGKLRETTQKDLHPKVYLVYPEDTVPMEEMKDLQNVNNVPIILMHVRPSPSELEDLLGYAGPNEMEEGMSAARLIVDAMREKERINPTIVAVGQTNRSGFNETYDAFEQVLQENNFHVINVGQYFDVASVREYGPPDLVFYKGAFQLFHDYSDSGITVDAVFTIDSVSAQGIFQALEIMKDTGIVDEDTIFVGNKCNVARDLLMSGAHYGTTLESPYHEGQLGMEMAAEYIQTGTLQEKLRLTPSAAIPNANWMFVLMEFLGETRSANELCTWDIEYTASSELLSELVQENCVWIQSGACILSYEELCELMGCRIISDGTVSLGYMLMNINLCLALLFTILLYKYRKMPVIQISQRRYVVFVTMGCVFNTLSIFFISYGRHSWMDIDHEILDRMCIVWPWFVCVGHMLTTATFVAKIYRVMKLMGCDRGGVRKLTVTVEQVRKFIVLFLSVDVLALLVITIKDPLKFEVREAPDPMYFQLREPTTSIIGECAWVYDGDTIGPILFMVLFAWHVLVLVYANVLCFITRKVHEFLSDARVIAICLFNSVQVLAIMIPLLFFTQNDAVATYLIWCWGIFLINFVILVVFIGPKVYACVRGRGNEIPQLSQPKSSMLRQKSRVHISGMDNVAAFDNVSAFDKKSVEILSAIESRSAIMEESVDNRSSVMDDSLGKNVSAVEESAVEESAENRSTVESAQDILETKTTPVETFVPE